MEASLERRGTWALRSPPLARRDDLDRVVLLQHGLAPVLAAHEVLIERGRDGLFSIAELIEKKLESRRADLQRLSVDPDPHS